MSNLDLSQNQNINLRNAKIDFTNAEITGLSGDFLPLSLPSLTRIDGNLNQLIIEETSNFEVYSNSIVLNAQFGLGINTGTDGAIGYLSNGFDMRSEIQMNNGVMDIFAQDKVRFINNTTVDFTGATVIGLDGGSGGGSGDFLPLNFDDYYYINLNGYSLNLFSGGLYHSGEFQLENPYSNALILDDSGYPNRLVVRGGFIDFQMNELCFFGASNPVPIQSPSYSGDNTDIANVAQDLANLRQALINYNLIN